MNKRPTLQEFNKVIDFLVLVFPTCDWYISCGTLHVEIDNKAVAKYNMLDKEFWIRLDKIPEEKRSQILEQANRFNNIAIE